jgi:hypothetical protein
VTVVGKPLRKLTAIALLLAAPVVSGCGGGDHASSEKLTQRPKGGYLGASDLERQMGNAFRKGLYRLAVMQQRSEDAVDLGQPLHTGLVDRVRCASTGARPAGGRPWAWSCSVRWRTVEHHAEQTRYTVRLDPGECFAAGASPPRRQQYDVTIRTYSEDPLNTLGSVRAGC